METGQGRQFMIDYALGSTSYINFMLESGAIKRSNDLIVLNFTKMFVSIHELSYILEDLLAHGTRQDAENFLKKYTR